MKNKLDWFDENWKWDAKPTQVLYELLLSPTYRWPKRVKEVHVYKDGNEFSRCHGVVALWNASTNTSVTAAASG